MITNEFQERVTGWFAGRLPAEWQVAPAEVTVDREEITVILTVADVELEGASEAALAEARAGRASAFREETRGQRMEIAEEAQHRFERKVSWGLAVGEHRELWTHVSAPTPSPGACALSASTRATGSPSSARPWTPSPTYAPRDRLPSTG